MAAMYASVDTMSNQIVLFTTLQGITMQMLILRLIRVLSAQKRLSILTTTAIKVCTVCLMLCLLGCAMLVPLCYACWPVLCLTGL